MFPFHNWDDDTYGNGATSSRGGGRINVTTNGALMLNGALNANGADASSANTG
jgi:hypothetical protein